MLVLNNIPFYRTPRVVFGDVYLGLIGRRFRTKDNLKQNVDSKVTFLIVHVNASIVFIGDAGA